MESGGEEMFSSLLHIINFFLYFLKSKIKDSPMAPPDISVPAHLEVMERFFQSLFLSISAYLSLFSETHFTNFFTSSESFGKRTSLGFTLKILASREYFESFSSPSSTSPLKNFLISSFIFPNIY